MKRLLFTLLLAAAAHCNMAALAAEKIHPFDSDSFSRIVASQKGRPFVVMVWSLDCDYCEASFDALARAQRQSGLKVITIATDRADDQEAARLIMKKLAQSGLKTEVWAFGPAPAEQLRYAIDPKWRGEMPRSYWFDRQGRARAYSGLIGADTVTRFLPQ
jgi:thiol-disulfide isomerase/thioredoxin